MATRFVRAADLPAEPLAAAADFYGRILPEILSDLDGAEDVVVGFEAADHSHRGWRLAAIQELARKAAPCRVNGVAGASENPAGSAELMQFLRDAPGVTGQYFSVDSQTGSGPAQ